MNIQAFLIYICVQAITPGPSNFMSLYTSASFGFRGARGYRLGSLTGFVVKMMLCGLLNLVLASVVPGLVPYLKWVGAAYLLYLAAHILIGDRFKKKQADQPVQEEEKKAVAATFWGGIMLQVLNIKSWIMGLTAFSVYIVPYTTVISDLLFWTLILACVMYSATLIWSIFGNAIKTAYGKYRLPFDIVFAAGLVYSAISAVL